MSAPFNTCPQCQCALQPFYLAIPGRSAVELDVCPRCKGIWLDRGELEQALGQKVKLEPLGGETSRLCARCRGPLLSMVTKRGVPLEYCPGCQGVFADAGELGDLGAKHAEAAAASAVRPRADFLCPKCQGRFPVSAGQGSALGLLCLGCTPKVAETPVLDRVEDALANARVGEPRFVGLGRDIDNLIGWFID